MTPPNPETLTSDSYPPSGTIAPATGGAPEIAVLGILGLSGTGNEIAGGRADPVHDHRHQLRQREPAG